MAGEFWVADEVDVAKAEEFGYKTFGGSDSHIVSRIGYCATDFASDSIETIDDLIAELRTGKYQPVTYREQ